MTHPRSHTVSDRAQVSWSSHVPRQLTPACTLERRPRKGREATWRKARREHRRRGRANPLVLGSGMDLEPVPLILPHPPFLSQDLIKYYQKAGDRALPMPSSRRSGPAGWPGLSGHLYTGTPRGAQESQARRRGWAAALVLQSQP